MCRVYSLAFPNKHRSMKFDIDYILESPLAHSTQGYLIAEAELVFENVNALNIGMDFQNFGGVDLVSVEIENESLTPNKKMKLYHFKIELIVGIITFTATGFYQLLKSDPMHSITSDFERY